MTVIRPSYIPADYNRVLVVDSLSALFEAATQIGADRGRTHNVALWPRRLTGDFNGLARVVAERSLTGSGERYFSADRNYLGLLRSGNPAMDEARDHMIADLDAVKAYQRKRFWFGGRLAADVRVIERYNLEAIEGFHKDGRPRFCCGYTAPVTEGLRDEDAVPVAGPLRGNVYTAKPGAQPFTFAPGDMWYHYGGGDAQRAPSFIHRGPACAPGTPRLLMIADLR